MSSKPISQLVADHYQWGASCDGWHLLRCADLSIIEERMPPGAQESRHRHHQARQFFYILAGEAQIECEGQTHVLRANEGLEIAPGQAHQIFNRSQSDLRFLVTSSPPAHGDRSPT